jgi:hypothetical protein
MFNISKLKYNFQRNISNIPGWRTDRKIVVIESDDWGSIRMPSKKTYDYLEAHGIDLASGDSHRYNQNDTLATKDDLSALFEVLERYKDFHDHPAVFTAVSIVANPDFKKIKDNNFQQYYYEPFTKTLERYYGDHLDFGAWKNGIERKIFIPQFHAREHLNISEWLRALQTGNKEALLAFEHGVTGYNNKKIGKSSVSFQAAFDLYNPEDLSIQAESIQEGLNLFEELFGYRATFFVPPNGPFNTRLEEVTAAGGIKYISTPKIQIEPQGYNQTRNLFHWLGKKNKEGQLYITRNCFFEPSQPGKDWVNYCLKDIFLAFRWHKPAIISSHRVNYIGVLNSKNREKGISELDKLLKSIRKLWPDAEFFTTSQLGDLINKNF